MSARATLSRRVLGVAALGLFAVSAQAGVVLLHSEGAVGQRRAYFADLGRIQDRTPMEQILAPVAIRQIDVYTVFESAAEADWSVVPLQFECAQPPPQYPGRRKRAPAAAEPPPRADSVGLQVGEGGYRMSREGQRLGIAAAAWRPANEAVASRAQALACNEVPVREAENAARGGDGFDQARFDAALEPLGLRSLRWVADTPDFFALREVAWSGLWVGAQRPKSAGDRPLSVAEKAQYQREHAAIAQTMARLAAQAQQYGDPLLRKHRVDQAFAAKAASIRGQRRLDPKEASAIMVWQGQPEQRVLERMGRAELQQSGELRLLSYSREHDDRSQLVNRASGQVVAEQGAHSRCVVTFVVAPDQDGSPRVADVRIEVQSTGIGGGDLCQGSIQVPEPGAQAR
ncbi:hypothetical protein ABU614_02965 [Lysobacter firmicutimachus]|uniref:Uncharacterized protein n=1 Tax=Lysobacter firmicutimachus TaxID=1792846 RepID=A0AAU8MX67_9GAMM